MTTARAQRYFEDVRTGEEFEESYTPTTENVIAFLETATEFRSRVDPSGAGSRFTDPAAAARDGLHSVIVPGVMSAATITRVVTDWMGPLGRIISLDVSFRRPVHHGDKLRCLAVVTDAVDESMDGQPGIAWLDVVLENERGEKPVQGTAIVELPRRS